jgi:hypothetical protein
MRARTVSVQVARFLSNSLDSDSIRVRWGVGKPWIRIIVHMHMQYVWAGRSLSSLQYVGLKRPCNSVTVMSSGSLSAEEGS